MKSDLLTLRGGGGGAPPPLPRERLTNVLGAVDVVTGEVGLARGEGLA